MFYLKKFVILCFFLTLKHVELFRIVDGQPGIMFTLSLDSSGLNHIMFAHNSVVLKNLNHNENNLI